MSTELIWTLVEYLLGISVILGVGTIAYMIIRRNGNPAKTISWILIIVFLPIVGALLYFTFGINYRRIKLYRRKKNKDIERYNRIIEDEYYQFDNIEWINKAEVKEKSGLAKLLLKSSKSLFTNDNEVKVLHNGKATFDKIFEELEKARKFIHIQYYIFEEGELAERFFQLFEKKIREGVEIRMIYDAVGSWSLSKSFKNRLTEVGVEHHEFLPVRFVQVANKINYRNHRKIIVIDAKKGFTGGINVSDKYLHGNHLGQWRDTFLFIEGNAVNGLQYLFISDWSFALKNNELFKREYFHAVTPKPGKAVQIVGSGPDSDYAGIMQEYDTIIHSAKEYVYITNPYLIPGEVIESALVSAAMRGVDVRILIPGKSDFRIVKWSSNSYLSSLLRAGVRIFKYYDGFLHSKVFVSDNMLTSIGTGNMDIRSFELNFEVNAVIYDEELSLHMKEVFHNDCTTSQEVTLASWNKRPWSEKILESLSRLVSPLL